jgi:hypothetical protein
MKIAENISPICLTSEQGKNRLPRTPNGRFEKGRSGNPGGRPKTLEAFKVLAQNYTEEAVNILVELMRTGRPNEKLVAAKEILDRGWGRPVAPNPEQEGGITHVTVKIMEKEMPTMVSHQVVNKPWPLR